MRGTPLPVNTQFCNTSSATLRPSWLATYRCLTKCCANVGTNDREQRCTITVWHAIHHFTSPTGTGVKYGTRNTSGCTVKWPPTFLLIQFAHLDKAKPPSTEICRSRQNTSWTVHYGDSKPVSCTSSNTRSIIHLPPAPWQRKTSTNTKAGTIPHVQRKEKNSSNGLPIRDAPVTKNFHRSGRLTYSDRSPAWERSHVRRK